MRTLRFAHEWGDPDIPEEHHIPVCPKCGSDNIFYANKRRRVVVHTLDNSLRYEQRVVRVGICRRCWHTDYEDMF